MAWEAGWQTMADNLVGFYFGSSILFYLCLLLLLFVLLLVAGIDIRFSILFMLPVVAVMSIGGAFGAVGWIYNVALLAVGIIYAYTIIKVFT